MLDEPSADPEIGGEVVGERMPSAYRGVHLLDLVARARWTVELVRVLAPRELRTRYRQSALDIAWALITPVSVLIVYGVVLTQSFNVNGRGVPYLSMAWSGLVLWTFFASAIGSAATSLVYAGDLVTKVYFPKEALPLSMVGASLVDLGIGLATLLVVLPVQGIRPGLTAIEGILPVVVLVVWTAALSVVVGVVAAFVRDVPHAVQLVMRVGFFATPVMYDAANLPQAWRWTADVSPVAVAISEFRDSVLRGEPARIPLLLAHLAVGTALLVFAVLYTRSVEFRLADVV